MKKEEIKSYSDNEIIEKVVLGETRLFEVLIRRYNPYLYKISRSYGYNHEDSQDIMQDAFINAYSDLVKFEFRSSFKTWLIKILLNICYHKKQKFSFKNELVQTNSINEASIPMYMNPKGTDTGKIILNRELNDIIANSLLNIPIEYRLVFSLREINGLNIKETADALDLSESNVKVRLNRAKSMLRTEIEKIYSAEDIFEFNLVYCDAMVNRVMNGITLIG